MVAAPVFRVSAAVVAGLALAVGFEPHGHAMVPRTAAPVVHVGLSATTDAEARQLRRATRLLAAEMATATRCRGRGFDACVTPALRHAGMGGRTTGMLVRGMLPAVPQGRCRIYLFRLGVANDAASDQARWLLPRLYGPGNHRREVAGQLRLMARMLGPPGVRRRRTSARPRPAGRRPDASRRCPLGPLPRRRAVADPLLS